MDPICHTLVGASLAQTGLGRKSAGATAALVLGANLPDVDGAALLFGGDTALQLRRGWTHGLPAVVLLPLLLTGALVLWHGRRGSRAALRPGVLLGLSYLAVATHPTLDWMNNYGMRWLMPFENRWFYGDTLFIVDPWMWLFLGGAVFLYASRRRASLAGWALFAAFAGVLLFTLVPGLALAKTLWLAGIVALVGLRIAGVGRSEPTARRIAVAAVAATTLYVAGMLVLSRYARTEVANELRARDLRVVELMVAPIPVTPFRREVVLRTPSGYRYGTATLWPFELELSPDVLPLPASSPVVEEALRSPSVEGFAHWARFPFGLVETSGADLLVTLLDARYAREAASGFGTAVVSVPRDRAP